MTLAKFFVFSAIVKTVVFVLQGDLEKTKEIEGYVIDCLLAMVMKLSEVSFRPLFFKVSIIT